HPAGTDGHRRAAAGDPRPHEAQRPDGGSGARGDGREHPDAATRHGGGLRAAVRLPRLAARRLHHRPEHLRRRRPDQERDLTPARERDPIPSARGPAAGMTRLEEASMTLTDRQPACGARRHLLAAALSAALTATLAVPAQAQAPAAGEAVTIGVMTDMSGVLSDLSGLGSLTAVRMAVED